MNDLRGYDFTGVIPASVPAYAVFEGDNGKPERHRVHAWEVWAYKKPSGGLVTHTKGLVMNYDDGLSDVEAYPNFLGYCDESRGWFEHYKAEIKEKREREAS